MQAEKPKIFLLLIWKKVYKESVRDEHSVLYRVRKDSIWGANEAKHHACLREQTEST